MSNIIYMAFMLNHWMALLYRKRTFLETQRKPSRIRTGKLLWNS